MNTSTHSELNLSYIGGSPLLFRLHNSKTSATFFDPNRKIVLASRYAPKFKNNSEELLDLLKSPDETPSLTPDEASVAKHVTSWKEGNTEPSEFISLTCSVMWAFWEWNRRMSRPSVNPPDSWDEFVLFVLESSELRERSKLATDILKRDSHRMAYDFAQSAKEVIVFQYIPKEAILGTKPIPISRLQDFIPSWWKKPLEALKTIPSENKEFKSFLSKVEPPTAADDRLQQSLRFVMALLAPLLVRNLQRRAHNERIVEPTGKAIGCSQVSGVNTKVDTSNDNMSLRKGKAEQRERSGSPETGGSLLAGTGMDGDSPTNASPAKRRRVSEDERTPGRNEVTALASLRSIDAEPSLSEGLPGWTYIRWLAADVLCQSMDESAKSWKEFEDDARGLLERYKSALGTPPKEDDPLEILREVMDKYNPRASDATKE